MSLSTFGARALIDEPQLTSNFPPPITLKCLAWEYLWPPTQDIVVVANCTRAVSSGRSEPSVMPHQSFPMVPRVLAVPDCWGIVSLVPHRTYSVALKPSVEPLCCTSFSAVNHQKFLVPLQFHHAANRPHWN